MRLRVNRKQATSKWLVKKVTNREYTKENAKEFSGVLSYVLAERKFYKHPKPCPEVAKVKKIGRRKWTKFIIYGRTFSEKVQWRLNWDLVQRLFNTTVKWLKA